MLKLNILIFLGLISTELLFGQTKIISANDTLFIGVLNEVGLDFIDDKVVDFYSNDLTIKKSEISKNYQIVAYVEHKALLSVIDRRTHDTLYKLLFIVQKLPNSELKHPKINIGNIQGDSTSLNNLKLQDKLYISNGFKVKEIIGFVTNPTIKQTTSFKIIDNDLTDFKKAISNCDIGSTISFFPFIVKTPSNRLLVTFLSSIYIGKSTDDNKKNEKIFLKWGEVNPGEIKLDIFKKQKKLQISDEHEILKARISVLCCFPQNQSYTISSNNLNTISNLLDKLTIGSVIVVDKIEYKYKEKIYLDNQSFTFVCDE